MRRRLNRVAWCIAAVLIVGVAAMWAIAYLALRPMPTWGVVILVVASLGWVREAYHLFRRSCLYAETLRYALTQGVSLEDAKAVAARYVDIRLPWGRPSADAKRVRQEAEAMSPTEEQHMRASALQLLRKSASAETGDRTRTDATDDPLMRDQDDFDLHEDPEDLEDFDEEDDDEEGLPRKPEPRVVVIPRVPLARLRHLEALLKQLHEEQRAIVARTPEYQRLRREGINEEESFQIADQLTLERGPLLHRHRILKCMREQEAVVQRARAIFREVEATRD